MKFILKNLSIIILLSIPTVIGAVWITDKIYVSNIEYLVFEGGGNGMQKGKLHIHDKEKAQRVVQILIHNPYFQHACGYWYTLKGYDRNNREVFKIDLNGQCDEFWFRDAEIQEFIKNCRNQLSKPKSRKI